MCVYDVRVWCVRVMCMMSLCGVCVCDVCVCDVCVCDVCICVCVMCVFVSVVNNWQGTYAIGRVELHYKTISIHNTDNKDICNTNNKLFMILYNCNFMMYCMQFHTGFM